MGTAAGRSLARRGRSVVVLEQHGPAHTRGSSHGASRIFRLAYPEPFWVELARTALDEWRALEAESGAELVVPTGSVDHGAADGVGAIAAALEASGAAVEWLASGAA